MGLSKRKAQEYGLVLASRGVPYHLENTEEGTDLFISPSFFHTAISEIHLYKEENRPSLWPQRNQPLISHFHRTYSGCFVAGIMFAIHAKLPSGSFRQTIIEHYGSSASHVLDGEIYRLITALFLHGDDAHLAGNMGGILIFGTAVAGLTGSGLGWFLILMSGIIGNGINAWFFESRHLSIGSSTAIFGAVGILAGLRSIRLFAEKGRHISIALPLGAGFALLGLLGSSAHSDVTAHLFGYLAGLFLSGLYARLTSRPPREGIQVLFLFITAALVIIAWYVPHL